MAGKQQCPQLALNAISRGCNNFFGCQGMNGRAEITRQTGDPVPLRRSSIVRNQRIAALPSQMRVFAQKGTKGRIPIATVIEGSFANSLKAWDGITSS